MNDIDNKIKIILSVEARFVVQSASRDARRSDAQEVHVEVLCNLHVEAPCARRWCLPCQQIHAPPDQTWSKLAACSKFTLPQTIRGGKDLEQWMFLILRTGSGVGFAAGDREQQVVFWELRRDSSGTAFPPLSGLITSENSFREIARLFRMAPQGHVQTLTPCIWERRRASCRCVRRGKCRSMNLKMRVLQIERTRLPHLKLAT